LIEQVQIITKNLLPSKSNSNANIDLKSFNNCVKAIFWVPHMKQYTNSPSNITTDLANIQYASDRKSVTNAHQYGNNWFNYSIYADEKAKIINTENIYLFKSGQILLNNEQRTPLLPAKYFANIQPQRYFDVVPFSNYIYTYSFALYPFEYQPSGTCNFSRFDSIRLSLNNLNCNNNDKKNTQYTQIDSDSNYVNLYALSYNVLLIKSGAAQIKYL
jgi:hypothetical protein